MGSKVFDFTQRRASRRKLGPRTLAQRTVLTPSVYAVGAWIDHTSYVGLCRRAGASRKFMDRRRLTCEGSSAALPTLLRQLRLQALMLDASGDWQRFKTRLQAVGFHAQRLGFRRVAAELNALDRALARASAPSPAFVRLAERHLVLAFLAATDQLPAGDLEANAP